MFEGEGLFIGLVKFAFHIDGGRLFDDIFKPFFEKQHTRRYINRLSGPKEKRDQSPRIYSPRAYRMFGSHGLAILALTDDYAFCSRIFNAGHIDVQNKKVETINQYKAVVLTGSSESFSAENPYLGTCAQETFLREGKRFPFIGIIRIKLNFRCLMDSKNGGKVFTQKTKQHIDVLGRTCGGGDCSLKSIIVDTYDNCELTVVAFSNSINELDTYLKRIREIKHSDIFSQRRGRKNKKKNGPEHICTSCHMSYGYDIGFDFTENCEGFFSWNDGEDSKNYSVNCLIEPKPGHRKDLQKYLKDLNILSTDFRIRRTVTGGSILHCSIPINKLPQLQQLAQEDIKKGQFRKHARRIKLTLNDNRESVKEESSRDDTGEEQEIIGVDNTFIKEVKKKLHAIGISKVVRERLLSLLDLYNDCARNPLHTYSFQRLHPSVENLKEILQDFLNNEEESLREIEQKLNEEITALESGFYNRMHNKMTPNVVLEYSGGIQQFLQAFGFAYKVLIRCLLPDQAAINYSLVTSVSKESSMRTHTELNINHIIYPQLFCVTSWKEASNFTMHVHEQRVIKRSRSKLPTCYNYFFDFLQNKESFKSLSDLILNQTDLVETDLVYRSLSSAVMPGVLKYSLQDYLVYHFAFQRDFELMWRYYLKVFLQTPSVYRRRGRIKREDFIFFLFRLMLVAYRETDETLGKLENFITDEGKNPFDYLLSDIWFECFEKVRTVAKRMCEKLELYGYSFVSEHLVLCSERYVYGSQTQESGNNTVGQHSSGDSTEFDVKQCREALERILDLRKEKISQMQEKFILCDNIADTTFNKIPEDTLCLMSAFLRAIDEIDKEKKKETLLHSAPHDLTTGELDFKAIKKLSKVAANLLADPSGGFIVPNPEKRKKYYACRTMLYRTLWDLSYRHGAKVYTNTKT